MKTKTLSHNTLTFLILWFGQSISTIGSGLTSFALGLWIYAQTGSVTQFALIALSSILPRLLLSPIAGVLVDRWDRRRTLILSDTGAGLCTFLLAVLFINGSIAPWHVYILAALSAAFGTIQWPAYTATIPLLVSEENLGRANGLQQFSQAAMEIFAPMLAGVLLLNFQVGGVILVDFGTFLFAVGTLLFIRLPQPPQAETAEHPKPQLLKDAAAGWQYIRADRGLLSLLIFAAVVNFIWGMVGAIITPMILSFTDARTLGIILTVAGLGMLTGSLVMSAWGGPKRRIWGVLGFELLSGVCFILVGLKPLVWLVMLAAFTAHLTIAIVSGSNQAIWQVRIPLELQGRAFATQQMVARSLTPLAYLAAGPLADRVFEPLLAEGGALAGSLGQVFGTGPGRGIGLLFACMGIAKLTVVLFGMVNKTVRTVEDEPLPANTYQYS
ncbi:MAG: MFS transporter [Anaerolineales bacterium]|nr:MFS transporter [Anaerolineales bacterium]